MTGPASNDRRIASEVGPDQARQALIALRAEVGKAVIGQDAAVTGLVIALLCRGHVFHRLLQRREQTPDTLPQPLNFDSLQPDGAHDSPPPKRINGPT